MGQNLAAGDYDIAWPDVVRLWYDEVKDFTLNGSNSLLLVGHFTQVIETTRLFFQALIMMKPFCFPLLTFYYDKRTFKTLVISVIYQ